MRCARCKHGWKASPPNEIDVVAPPAPEPTPIPKTTTPIPEGSNLPTLVKKSFLPDLRYVIWATPVICLLVLLVWFIVDRQHIARHWTFLEPAYNAIGLYIYYPGDGLEFDDVRSELKFDGGITKLVLDGKIKNKTKSIQKVPNIVADALGSDGMSIQSWQIDAPKATLGPEEEVTFSSSMNAPKGTVVNVTLNFTETTDDN